MDFDHVSLRFKMFSFNFVLTVYYFLDIDLSFPSCFRKSEIFGFLPVGKIKYKYMSFIKVKWYDHEFLKSGGNLYSLMTLLFIIQYIIRLPIILFFLLFSFYNSVTYHPIIIILFYYSILLFILSFFYHLVTLYFTYW